MSEFASSKYTAGRLNAMVKRLRALGGEEGPELLLNGRLSLVKSDEPSLLKPLATIQAPDICGFVARQAFTEDNGIEYIQDNFREFLLPLVERNIAATTLVVSELTRRARDLSIAKELKVDENSEVALAHFSHAIHGEPELIYGIVAAYIIGTDNETWVARADQVGVRWHLRAYRLGNRHDWRTDVRFLSRQTPPIEIR